MKIYYYFPYIIAAETTEEAAKMIAVKPELLEYIGKFNTKKRVIKDAPPKLKIMVNAIRELSPLVEGANRRYMELALKNDSYKIMLQTLLEAYE